MKKVVKSRAQKSNSHVVSSLNLFLEATKFENVIFFKLCVALE